MDSARSCRRVVTVSDEEFDSISAESYTGVELSTEKEEEAYEKRDETLCQMLDGALESIIGKQYCEVLYHQNYDWWPTQTRFLELDSLPVTWRLVTHLQGLLPDCYGDWCINTQIYRPLDGKPSEHLGAVNIYSDWLLMSRRVLDLLEGRE